MAEKKFVLDKDSDQPIYGADAAEDEVLADRRRANMEAQSAVLDDAMKPPKPAKR